MLFLSLKTLHIVAVIAWMAALLYLPRLFVYHCDAMAGSDKSETFKIMERRLLKAIMTPAMLVTWAAGLGLVAVAPVLAGPWLWLKLALVALLSAIHMFYATCIKAFAQDKNQRSAKFYRLMNEVPAVLMVLIVALVVYKPF